MSSRLFRSIILVAVVFTLFQLAERSAVAVPPWQSLVSFKKVDADPAKSYRLTQENGPWMILAMTFSGDDAMQDAKALVFELRKDHKLKAFTHEKVFDYSEPVLGRGFDKYGDAMRMRHSRSDRMKEVAVMVGNYDSVDSTDLEKTLKKIKKLQPKSVGGKSSHDADKQLKENSLADFLMIKRGEASQKSDRGPLGMAFVAPNPLLPQSYFRPGGVDKFVADMNSGIKHSLLKNDAPYTVKVATFNGQAVVDPKDIQRIENGGKMKSRLEQAAIDAHRMCVALRAKGYDAYEFHDRYSSIVTVGGFESLGMQGIDGSYMYEPEVLKIVQKFASKPVYRGMQGVQTNGDRMPQSILNLPFDLEPTPMEVPRRSFGKDYAGALSSR